VNKLVELPISNAKLEPKISLLHFRNNKQYTGDGPGKAILAIFIASL
jgi:hypothetical protein